jgi:hypothetical protein
MGRLVVIAAVLVSLTACEKKKNEGLPPAQEWGGNPGDMPPVQQQGKANPHAGIDMSNPHGEGGGVDVEKMGLPAPDPSRPIDPTHRVKGVIKVHAKAKSHVAAGGTVFVIIKKAGPDGAPSGPPVAVDKLTWQKDELPFEMTERQAMIAGTELTGDVVVTARYDQDGDALSKQPGDIVGTLKVKIPADNVTLTLDDVLN